MIKKLVVPPSSSFAVAASTNETVHCLSSADGFGNYVFFGVVGLVDLSLAESALVDHERTHPWSCDANKKGGQSVSDPVSEYERRKCEASQALAVEELSDAEIEAIRRAEPPAEAAEYDYELTAGCGSGI